MLCFDASKKYDDNQQRKERETIQANNDFGGNNGLKRDLKFSQNITSIHDDTPSDLEEYFHLDVVHQI